MALVEGLRASASEAALVQYTRPVCGPVLSDAPISLPQYTIEWANNCIRFNEDVRRDILEKGTVRHVVMSSTFMAYLDPQVKVLHAGRVDAPNKNRIVEDLLQTIDLFSSQGISTTVVAPPPRNGLDIGKCLARAHWLGRNPGQCEIKREDFEAKYGIATDMLREVQKAGARVIFLEDYLCDDKVCRVEEEGIHLYRDAGHLSREGSRLLGQKLNLYNIATGRSAGLDAK
jgi:hypothetical protein